MPKQSGNKGGGSLPEVHDFLLDQQVLQGPKEENKILLDLIESLILPSGKTQLFPVCKMLEITTYSVSFNSRCATLPSLPLEENKLSSVPP